MTVLKRNKNIQWKQAQQRINVSPLVSRISGLALREGLQQLVWLLGRVSS